MIFFTSDTHLGHTNIIRYCNRPFASIEEMDETIINNWNNVVDDNDTVYHLGDFSFGNPYHYKKRLKGRIELIAGNHDFKYECRKIFDRVYELHTIKIENKTIVLCHFAMRVWPKSHFNAWHLYGHSHGMLEPFGKSFDVGVDGNNFTPVSFETIRHVMDCLPDNPNWTARLKGFDQHEFAKKVDQGVEVD
jgi:calcineurin-like phosphoesterase family protein